MEGQLRGRLIRFVPSTEGRQAELFLLEPNGDEHPVRCLVQPTGSQIYGEKQTLDYLHDRYGHEDVCLAAQGVVMGID